MRLVKAKWNKRVRIEPEIKDRETYRIGSKVCHVVPFNYDVGAIPIWGNTRVYQDIKGKIRGKC